MIGANIFAEMLDRVRRVSDDLIAARVLPAGIDLSRVTIEPPRDAAHRRHGNQCCDGAGKGCR